MRQSGSAFGRSATLLQAFNDGSAAAQRAVTHGIGPLQKMDADGATKLVEQALEAEQPTVRSGA